MEKVASYLYDIDGYRIEKENKEGELTHFIFDVSGKILEEIDVESSQTISSVFLKSRHLARVTSDETLYYGTDHQGTTVLMTDEAGVKVWTSEATPFGDAIVTKTGNRDDLALKYTGKDLDEDTGLYYFNARWYDASTGRFISEDPASDGANWYVYVSNNPLKFVDPTGMRLDDNLETDLDTPNRRKRYAEREKEKEEYRRNKDATSYNIRYPDSKNTYTPSDPSSDGPMPKPEPEDKEKPITTPIDGQPPVTPGNGGSIPSGQDIPKKALIQIVFGARGSLGLGAEAGIGIVINPNDLLDCGILIKGAIGVGIEINVDTPLNILAEAGINAALGAADFTVPTSTQDIEGEYTKTTAGVLLGVEQDLLSKNITGVNALNIGGGVYKGKTTVITIQDVINKEAEVIANFFGFQ